MRIVLTHPYCWPHVRRGTERVMQVLGEYLVADGHDVITVSTRPGPSGTERSAAGTRILRRPLTFPCMAMLRVQTTHTFFFTAWRVLRSLDADVVHSFYPSDALAAICVKRRTRLRAVLQLNGVPVPGVSCYRYLPPEGAMFREALRRADRRIACSRFVRDLMREHYGVDADVIPTPIPIESYEVGGGPPDRRPTILALADFNVRRKGVRVLVDAFALVKRQLPDVRLRLSGRMSPALQSALIGNVPGNVREGIEVLGLGQVDDIPRLYREATITALPAMWEPSGTVLLESFASGTPVVATNHAGIPEFVTPEVGVLFEPRSTGEETHNAEGLATALIEGLSLAAQPGTRERCRAHAIQYCWPALGPRIAALYRADGADRAAWS
jgi:phosphatidyl-myo-inositol alpha-mannosyltransferase